MISSWCVVTVVLFVSIHVSWSMRCPPSYIPHFDYEHSTCIEIHTDKLSWEEARQACQEDGGDLLRVGDTDLNQFILDQIETEVSISTSYWIGLTDRKVEGEFMWLDETQPAEVYYWKDGEPSSDDDKDCVAYVGKDQMHWMVARCSRTRGYICQRVPARTCPTDSDQYQDTCIHVREHRATWSYSRYICQEWLGGDLVVIRDQAKSDFISNLLEDPDALYWIGANDIRQEGKFVWLDETEEAKFTNWGPGEPTLGDYEYRDEDCVKFFPYSNGLWADDLCSLRQRFICQKDTVNDTCQYEWHYDDHTCIRVDRQYRSWTQARAVCQGYGGDLVKITDMEMNDFIEPLVRAKRSNVWIGLRDMDQEGTYVWLDETVETSFTNWASGEPNNNMHYAFIGEDCVTVNSNMQWSDLHCQTNYHSMICETEPDFYDHDLK